MNKIILLVGLVAVAVFFVFISTETKEESITKSIDTIAPLIVKEKKVYENEKVTSKIDEIKTEVLVQKEIVKKEIETMNQEINMKIETIKKSSMPTAFASCVACHGKTGEKKALNKSKILADMSKQEIIAALNGYINNTYGGSMKAIMTSQAKNLSKEDIEDIAAYIDSSK